jgi:hypothetical protein
MQNMDHFSPNKDRFLIQTGNQQNEEAAKK